MESTWSSQQADPESAQLAFDERFALLVDAEWMDRHNKKLARTLREAQLRIRDACVENLQASAPRGLEKAVIRQLATCQWIQENHNLVITGACGVGKTYVACAFAQQACRKGYRVLYRRAPRLFEELVLARADGSYGRLLGRIARFDVLVIDDWALTPLDDLQRRDMLEIFEDRYAQRSTIIASQLPSDHWHTQVGEPTIADAICDRLLHNAIRVTLRGPSRRRPKAEPEVGD